MEIAMLGTRGVPARYGGFETAIEEIGSRLAAKGHRVRVYCRNQGQTQKTHKGMELLNLPAVRRSSLETLSHTGLSALHSFGRKPDVAVLFNAGNAPFIPVLRARGIPTAVHVDGLEWKRAKWQGLGAKYYKWAEGVCARSETALIADAQGIADYLQVEYNAPSYLIAYGAEILDPGLDKLGDLNLQSREFHLVVARMEPENHVDLIVEGYCQAGSSRPLVVVGSAPYQDEYIASLKELAKGHDVRFVGSVWDQDLLNQLYAHARSYLHGHSVGGTNPSLLRALGCGAPVTAFDVNFNHEVTAEHARFFSDAKSAATAIRADDADLEAARSRGTLGQRHVEKAYRWDEVADRYEQMLVEIAG
ncbi:DUF1972 domain-containing protein [Nocardioides panaciterrulae]|uniref:Glycosyltransferase involved in cell wall biosynthesis n=1 Tax=Nocardioides panaciterrulae TaxID=661492 RepID=A0A7Y9JAR5_9ACTN|nr:DUF1972 domain-containing protein [Nocardioides panaciterrulae]NYD40509.1 glycosyltransferase involved in cell wall biosynthesis [Nocardioides panaciterrulae]